MLFKTFGGAFAVTAIGLVLAYLYGGATGLAVAAILGVLEISVSFDNAVVNATYLQKLNDFWQKMFLTVGVLIAVFGMRLLFPVVIVCVTAQISPAEAYRLALDGGSVDTPGTYAYLLSQAHPAIAAFGGMFLLMLFLDFMFEEREISWLVWLERPLARIGKLDQVSVIVAASVLLVFAGYLTPAQSREKVLVAGVLGLIVYILVNGLGDFFQSEEEAEEAEEAEAAASGRGTGDIVRLAGRAAFGVFLYLEVLDATFSFDGVIGAFAITSDPIIIAIGLGIGAMYIRSLTVFLVRKGVLGEYVYLEHGAQWAIGSLALLLLFTIQHEVPEVVTGLIGVGFIGASFLSSVVRNRRAQQLEEPDDEPDPELSERAGV